VSIAPSLPSLARRPSFRPSPSASWISSRSRPSRRRPSATSPSRARPPTARPRRSRKPGAPEELERLEARQEYLRVQLDDVAGAREELLQLISELDDAAKTEFLRTFAEVAVAFEEVFQRLFDGGETRLELTLPDDPLNGGVEIIVRPPGKRLQNLMLLSGGERALTATAFVFALLRVRPSPFCVLDEIDAALDAASTDRFIALLGEFAELSQFILVTHNPQTITAADRLYGVTMQTPGVSMVLAVQLEEAREMASDGRTRPQLRITPAT
jgi:chromosome segregation protein